MNSINSPGKGANSAFMCSRLGLSASLVATLGDDHFGKLYLNYLKSAGIHSDHIKVINDCPSATASITVTQTGENSIAYCGGSADRLTVGDIDNSEPLFKSAKVSTKRCL